MTVPRLSPTGPEVQFFARTLRALNVTVADGDRVAIAELSIVPVTLDDSETVVSVSGSLICTPSAGSSGLSLWLVAEPVGGAPQEFPLSAITFSAAGLVQAPLACNFVILPGGPLASLTVEGQPGGADVTIAPLETTIDVTTHKY